MYGYSLSPCYIAYNFITGNRVAACVTGLAASGGYYIAAAADEIMAQPTAITGSIGVIAMKLNVDELFSKIGIQEETVKSGEKKDLWSPFRPTTPEEAMIMQKIIDTLHERFVRVVVSGREPLLDQAEVRDGPGEPMAQSLDPLAIRLDRRALLFGERVPRGVGPHFSADLDQLG